MPSTTSCCSQCCGSPISALVASRMSRMFSISSSSVEERLEPRPRHVRHVAAGDHDVAHARRTAQVVEHVAEPVVGLADELQLVDHGGRVADEVHPRAVPAVLRAGRQQLGQHLGRVAVGQALGRPHVVLVERVAGGVRVRGPVGTAVAEDREHVAADRVGVERVGQRARRRSGRPAAPSCSSSAAARASTSWPARPGRARGRRRTRSSTRSPISSRSCLTFLTQWARCHCTDCPVRGGDVLPAGEPGPVGLDQLDAPVGVGLPGLATDRGLDAHRGCSLVDGERSGVRMDGAPVVRRAPLMSE